MTERTLDIILTGDGSHTLYVPELDETYHSRHGAIRESQHVFIENGLKYLLESWESKKVKILEVGFGTGLNVLVTEEFCQLSPHIVFEYTSLEPFPIPHEINKKLNYTEEFALNNKSWVALHSAQWGETVQLLPNFELTKLKSKIQDFETGDHFNLVFFDAFAPSKQPEMWDIRIFEKIFNMLRPGGILVTYCAQGQFKRTLNEAGFKVEALPGPPGKKEMVRACK